MDDDPLAPIEKEVLWLVLLRIKMRARMALEVYLQELEDRAGRELPTVRAQLSELAAHPELPVLPPGVPGAGHQSADDDAPQRKRGRPKKQREADEFDAPGTELS